jgi:hypothetical protein
MDNVSRYYTLGTDVLVGAADDTGLKNQYIVIRVNKIDPKKLGQAMDAPSPPEGGAGKKLTKAVLPLMPTVLNNIPKFVLDMALPVAAKTATDYGIDATVFATNVPPAQGGRDKSEFVPGVVTGALGAGVVIGLGYGVKALVKRITRR